MKTLIVSSNRRTTPVFEMGWWRVFMSRERTWRIMKSKARNQAVWFCNAMARWSLGQAQWRAVCTGRSQSSGGYTWGLGLGTKQESSSPHPYYWHHHHHHRYHHHHHPQQQDECLADFSTLFTNRQIMDLKQVRSGWGSPRALQSRWRFDKNISFSQNKVLWRVTGNMTFRVFRFCLSVFLVLWGLVSFVSFSVFGFFWFCLFVLVLRCLSGVKGARDEGAFVFSDSSALTN